MRWGILVSIVAALLPAAVAGCGGDDGSEETTLSRAAYVQQADAICADAESRKNAAIEAKFTELREEGRELDREIELQMVRTVALPPVSRMVEELAALPDPSAGAEEAAAIVAAYEEAVEEVADDPLSALSEPTPFTAANTLALDFGLEACAST